MMRKGSGFTLLEVLVAFTILALTIGAVMATISTGLKGSRSASQYAVATLIAESKMAAVGIERPAEESGISGTTEEGYNWEVSVAPYPFNGDAELGSEQFEPLLVKVTVSWGGSSKRRSVSLTSVRLKEVR